MGESRYLFEKVLIAKLCLKTGVKFLDGLIEIKFDFCKRLIMHKIEQRKNLHFIDCKSQDTC